VNRTDKILLESSLTLYIVWMHWWNTW